MKIRTHRGLAWLLRLLYEDRGQDLIEYALLASAIAVAAGAVMPPVSNQVSVIFSKITNLAQSTPAAN
jgi:Flp pilus assembly pilin Flp